MTNALSPEPLGVKQLLQSGRSQRGQGSGVRGRELLPLPGAEALLLAPWISSVEKGRRKFVPSGQETS